MALVAKSDSYSYPSSGMGVREVSLSVAPGEGLGLLGPNGAGKSTLLLLLAGLIRPDSGSITVLGHDTRSEDFRRSRFNIGVVFQDPDDMLFNPTVFDDVAYSAVNAGLGESEVEEAVTRALASVDAVQLRDREPSRLSFGEKRRVALAAALVLEPKVLLMDEPTANLDGSARRELVSLVSRLKGEGVAVLVSSHDVEAMPQMTDNILLLKDGNVLAEGSKRAILTDEPLLAEARLEPPQITRLFLQLRKRGVLVGPPLTLDEAENVAMKFFRSKKTMMRV